MILSNISLIIFHTCAVLWYFELPQSLCVMFVAHYIMCVCVKGVAEIEFE